MIVFFAIVAAVGAFMIYTDHYADKYPDSIPTELCGGTPYGLLMIFVGIVGAGCVWAFG